MAHDERLELLRDARTPIIVQIRPCPAVSVLEVVTWRTAETGEMDFDDRVVLFEDGGRWPVDDGDFQRGDEDDGFHRLWEGHGEGRL